MRALAGVALLAAASFARAASPPQPPAERAEEVARGTFRVLVRVQGTVAAEDVFRLKSTIEGRIESVLVSSRTWAKANQPLGYLANTELAALIDTKGSTTKDILEERWQRVYQPTKVHCPEECYVMRVFAKPKLWVQPDTVLVEAASRLRLIGRVRPGDSHWVKDGMLIKYWPRSDPKHKQEARVERFVLDTQGMKVDPGGTFSALLDSWHYLDPGTEWEGMILALVKKNVLSVPTSSLLFHDGEVFLPVRVSTGITTYDFTEIEAGASEKQRFLILDPTHPPPTRLLPSSPPPAAPKGQTITEEDLMDYYRKKPATVTPTAVPADVPKNEDFPSDLE